MLTRLHWHCVEFFIEKFIELCVWEAGRRRGMLFYGGFQKQVFLLLHATASRRQQQEEGTEINVEKKKACVDRICVRGIRLCISERSKSSVCCVALLLALSCLRQCVLVLLR